MIEENPEVTNDIRDFRNVLRMPDPEVIRRLVEVG